MAGKKLFIGDLHIGHKNMALKRGFKSVEEHDQYIFERWNAKVRKKDSVWILGDLTMEKRNYEFLKELKGFKFVVSGNHDMYNHSNTLMEYVGGIVGAMRQGHIIYTHIPIHPQELEYKFKYNVHAHTHEKSVLKQSGRNKVRDERYVCCSCEQVGYEPKSLEELLKIHRNLINNK